METNHNFGDYRLKEFTHLALAFQAFLTYIFYFCFDICLASLVKRVVFDVLLLSCEFIFLVEFLRISGKWEVEKVWQKVSSNFNFKL